MAITHRYFITCCTHQPFISSDSMSVCTAVVPDAVKFNPMRRRHFPPNENNQSSTKLRLCSSKMFTPTQVPPTSNEFYHGFVQP